MESNSTRRQFIRPTTIVSAGLLLARKEQFGQDGFEDAVKQISAIEGSFGLTDIAQFTAPPPPRVSGT